MGTIIFRLWNEASLINCTAISGATLLLQIFPKSPKEAAGSHCEGLGGGGEPPACLRCVLVLFRNDFGVSARETFEMVGELVYEALVFTGKCRGP